VRWADERYVRIYTRDTPDLAAMGWEARALLWEVFRKMDRAGILQMGKSGHRGLAALVSMPFEVTERALLILLEDGVLEAQGTCLVCKNFMEAQECSKSDAGRQRDKRERDRVAALSQNVTSTSRDVPQESRIVTDSHELSRDVTPYRTVPYRADPVPKKRSPRAAHAEPSQAFSEFWMAYPKKTGKGQAMKAWPGDEFLPNIMAALSWQVATWDPKYTKNPATWLNARCWEDEKSQPSLFQRPSDDPTRGSIRATVGAVLKTGRIEIP